MALGVEQRGALGTGKHDRLALGAVLGERVPDIALVARQHIGGKRAALLPSGFWIVVHETAFASLPRSSSGSMALSAAGVI